MGALTEALQELPVVRKLDLRGNDALTAQVLIGYWRSKCKWSARSCVGLCVYCGSRRAKTTLGRKSFEFAHRRKYPLGEQRYMFALSLALEIKLFHDS